MCTYASQTWRMTASVIFRAPERVVDSEVEIEHKNMIEKMPVHNNHDGKTYPLVIPNVMTSSMATSMSMDPESLAFSAMSLDTIPIISQASSLSSTTDEAENPCEADEVSDEANLSIISMAEVREHSEITDGWMVIYDKVYDVTQFLQEVIE